MALRADWPDRRAVPVTERHPTWIWARRDGRPKAIVAHSTKGKGVRFMEGDNRWHYLRLDADTYS